MVILAEQRSNAEVQAHDFELIGGHPALDLVNTLDWRFRQSPPPVELLADYNDLVRFTELSGLINRAQAARSSIAIPVRTRLPPSLPRLATCGRRRPR